MQLRKPLGSLVLATVVAMRARGGCVVTRARVAPPVIATPVAVVSVEEGPPAARVVVMETRPGYVAIEGRWVRMNNQWVWRDGYYERERVGYRAGKRDAGMSTADSHDLGRWSLASGRPGASRSSALVA